MSSMFDVVTIGAATRDVFLQSRFFRIFKDAQHLRKIGFPTGEAECFALGAKLEVAKPVFTTGGGATNAAVTFSRQGLRTAVVFKIGNDAAGKDIINGLKKEKIATFVSIDKKFGTGYSTILLTPVGERTILVYRGISELLSAKDVSLKSVKTKWLYISSLAGNLDLLKRIVDFAKSKKISIAYNPGGKELARRSKLVPILRHIQVVIANREEASLITGISYKNERLIFKQWDNMSPGINVMTDGPRGVLVSDGEFIYKAGIFKEKKLVDRTGAGDAFGSGFVAGLIKKKDIKYAIRFGSANATSVVEHIGAKDGILNMKDSNAKRWANLKINIYKS